MATKTVNRFAFFSQESEDVTQHTDHFLTKTVDKSTTDVDVLIERAQKDAKSQVKRAARAKEEALEAAKPASKLEIFKNDLIYKRDMREWRYQQRLAGNLPDAPPPEPKEKVVDEFEFAKPGLGCAERLTKNLAKLAHIRMKNMDENDILTYDEYMKTQLVRDQKIAEAKHRAGDIENSDESEENPVEMAAPQNRVELVQKVESMFKLPVKVVNEAKGQKLHKEKVHRKNKRGGGREKLILDASALNVHKYRPVADQTNDRRRFMNRGGGGGRGRGRGGHRGGFRNNRNYREEQVAKPVAVVDHEKEYQNNFPTLGGR